MFRVAAASLLSAATLAAAQPIDPPMAVYWTDSLDNAIWRADLDGANRIRLIENVPDARGITISQHTIFWTDRAEGVVKRADLDGANIAILASGNIADPAAIDTDSVHLFWVDESLGRLERMNTDGSNRTLIHAGLDRPRGIAVQHGLLYWSEIGPDQIWRSDYDGNGNTLIISSGLADTLEIDVHGDLLYLSDFGTDNIRRANLSGGQIQVIQQFPVGTASPIGIEAYGSHVYWTDSFRDRIERKRTDGSGTLETLYSSARLPEAIAIGPKCRCPLDLAEPACTYDLADVQIFAEAFVNQQPLADLAEPSGIYDLFDISAFVAGFTAGCR